MGNVQMEAAQIRFKNASYGNVQTALTAALTGGGGLDDRVDALEETVGDESSGLVKDVDDLETTVGDLETAVALLNPNIYSLTETEVGTWFGEKLYRKCVDFGALPINTVKKVSSGLTANETVRRIDGVLVENGYVSPLPYQSLTLNDCIPFYYDCTTNECVIYTGKDYSAKSAIIFIEYTKNPVPENNNR